MREALNRTLLLMRDHLQPEVTDEDLIEALAGVTVVVRCNAECARTHAGQSAVAALCALLARSGHRVYVDAPDVALAGAQPPARASTLLAAVAEVAAELPTHPGTMLGLPARADIEFLLGGGPPSGTASRVVELGWEAWAASLGVEGIGANESEWPFGALAAAALAAGEAFKVAMRRLVGFATERSFFKAQYAETAATIVTLAPRWTPIRPDLGEVDFISAGAISHAALYVLLRLPGIELRGRIFDDDQSALSNLNRNMLLLHRSLEAYKVQDLAAFAPKGMLRGITRKFGEDANDDDLARRVLVGVDHIPSRWVVQRAAHEWVGVGATSHFTALVSAHPAGAACAGCMHPRDEPDFGPIPTVSFVSFWAGLLLAVELVRDVAAAPAPAHERQTMICPLRPEAIWRSGIAARRDCPTPCGLAVIA